MRNLYVDWFMCPTEKKRNDMVKRYFIKCHWFATNLATSLITFINFAEHNGRNIGTLFACAVTHKSFSGNIRISNSPTCDSSRRFTWIICSIGSMTPFLLLRVSFPIYRLACSIFLTISHIIGKSRCLPFFRIRKSVCDTLFPQQFTVYSSPCSRENRLALTTSGLKPVNAGLVFGKFLRGFWLKASATPFHMLMVTQYEAKRKWGIHFSLEGASGIGKI